MSLWSKIRPLVEAAVVLFLVCAAIFFTERDPTPLSKSSGSGVNPFVATDIGNHLLSSAGLTLDGHRTFSFKGFSSLRSDHSSKNHHFKPLAAGAVAPLICANNTFASFVGLYGDCQYLVPLGQTGCCLSDPVDVPHLDYWCPAATLTKQHFECFRQFTSFWCNAVCNPWLTTNSSCSARFYNLNQLCAPVCPYLVQFLPAVVLDSSLKTPLGNDTVCNYSLIPLPTAAPNITQFTAINGGIGNLVQLNNVTVPPTVYFLVSVNGPAPASGVVRLESGGQVYFAYTIPHNAWFNIGNNVSQAQVAAYIDLTALVASSVWNFTVTAVCGNAIGATRSTPVFVALNISAPVNKTVATFNVGGCDGSGEGGSGSFNNTSPTGGAAISSISNLNCLCASSCTFVSAVEVIVVVTVLQINASVTQYSSNMVVNSALNLGPLATQLVLASAALLTLQCPVTVSSAYQFSGSSSSTLAFNGSTSTFSAPVAFSGPAVTLVNTILSLTAAVLTVNSTSTCLISNTSSINLDSSSALVASGASISTTVLSVIGGTITGSGQVKLRQGIAKFQKATILVKIVLNVLIVFTRQTSPQATVTSCGDTFGNGFSFDSSQTQLTVDESCTSAQTSYASVISTSLTVPSGSILQLTNVASSSNPLLISGSFSVAGTLNIVFASSPGSVLSKTIISYSSGTCSAPSSSLVTFSNTPSGISNYTLTASSSGGLCNLQLSALVVSTTFSLTLSQLNTYTSSNFLTTLKAAMPALDTSLINVVSITPGSVIVAFNCLAGDTTTAQTTCNSIYTTAVNPTSALYSALGVIILYPTTSNGNITATNTTTTTPTTTTTSTTYTFGGTTGGQGSGDNKRLLGLIVIVAIIPIAAIAIYIYKVKSRPEIQYEDTGKDFQLPPEGQPQPYVAAQPQPYVVNQQQFPAYYGAPQAPVQYYATPTPTPTPYQ